MYYEEERDQPEKEKELEVEAEFKDETEEAKAEETAAEAEKDTLSDTDAEYHYSFRDTHKEPAEAEAPKKSRSTSEHVYVSRSAIVALAAIIVAFSLLVGLGAYYIPKMLAPTPAETEATPTPGSSTAPIGGIETPSESGAATKSPSGSQSVPDETYSVVRSELVSALSVKQIAAKCIDTVVVIEATGTQNIYGMTSSFTSGGSGVIFSKDGYIVTNYHVVDGTTKIMITLNSGVIYEARYVAGDADTDIAILKIEKDDCEYATFGSSADLVLGDNVVVIGNPLGYGLTVTNGIISALERDIAVEDISMTLLQTNAAVNAGNSGGGMFNDRGELVGIVNAKIGGTTVEGMGFAIPADAVAEAISDLSDYGYIRGRFTLGISAIISTSRQFPSGMPGVLMVYSIADNSNASRAGMKVGDRIYSLQGRTVTTVAEIKQILSECNIGDTLTVVIYRNGEQLTLSTEIIEDVPENLIPAA